MIAGDSSKNLPSNRETNVFRLLRSKLIGFGDKDDNYVQELPEELSWSEHFRTVWIALVSTNELLILLGKR